MADAILSPPPAIPLVPSDVGNLKGTMLRYAQAINQMLRGTIGATMGVTLASGATFSNMYDSRIGPFTSIRLMPTTAHAVDLLPTIWVDCGKGVAAIHHGNVTYTDLTFVAVLIG